MELGNWPKLQKWCTYSLSIPQAVKIELIFTLRAAVSETWANFQNCQIWAWNLAIGQTSRRCTHTVFLHQGVKIELIFALWAVVSEIPIFKIAIFGHETWPLALLVPEVAHVLSFYPRRSKLNLFSLYGQHFLRYGPIFNIATFGHETLPLAKVPHYTLFLPQAVEIELFLLHGQRFPRYRPIFKIASFGHET